MQRLPVAVVLRGYGYETRIVVLAALAQHEHHLSGIARELLLGRAYDALGLGVVVGDIRAFALLPQGRARLHL